MAQPHESKLKVLTRPTAAESKRLREEIAELEKELEALNNAVAQQRLSVIDGYVVSVRADLEGGYLAHCPTLRAVAEGESAEAALQSLRDAMQASLDGHKHCGMPVPPEDTEAQCPG